MSGPLCIHGNFSACAKCEALDIPEVEELEQGYRARIAELEELADDGLVNGLSHELIQARARIAELEARMADEQSEHAKTNDLLRQITGSLAHCVNERDAAKALAKEWEAKAMDAANHPVVQVLLQERDAAKAEAERLTVQVSQWVDACTVGTFPDSAAQGTGFWGRMAAKLTKERNAARAGEARAWKCVEALRRRIHAVEQHNQLFERCESGWCNPSETRTFADCDDPAGIYAASAHPALDWLAQVKREAAAEAWKTAITLAHGCHDYGGGHTGDKYEAFQHGIDTVIRVLEAKRDGDDGYQMKVVESVGAAALRAGKVQG